MTLLDPTQNDMTKPHENICGYCIGVNNRHKAYCPHHIKGPRYKVVATAEFLNHKPAHQRWITKQGQGSSLRTACKDAIDKIFKAKTRAHKMPFKVVFQEGGE